MRGRIAVMRRMISAKMLAQIAVWRKGDNEALVGQGGRPGIAIGRGNTRRYNRRQHPPINRRHGNSVMGVTYAGDSIASKSETREYDLPVDTGSTWMTLPQDEIVELEPEEIIGGDVVIETPTHILVAAGWGYLMSTRGYCKNSIASNAPASAMPTKTESNNHYRKTGAP